MTREEFWQRVYIAAMNSQIDSFAEDCADIALEEYNDRFPEVGKEGNET